MLLRDVDAIRYDKGRSVLLFLTDNCPVGCAHCSVDSRPDSPRVSDRDLFRELTRGIVDLELSLVGISGGEPFVERWALRHATHAFRAAGLPYVIYTSCVWAKNGECPPWIAEILQGAESAFISLDAFHNRQLKHEEALHGISRTLELGTDVILQVLDLPDERAAADDLIHNLSLRGGFAANIEVNPLKPLPYGRGETHFSDLEFERLAAWGGCRSLAAPTVRYDGVVTACCNERVIMGSGPSRLRAQARSAKELTDVVNGLLNDPVLTLMERRGPKSIAAHPDLLPLMNQRYSGICGACWTMLSLGQEQKTFDSSVWPRLAETLQ